ncbi:MAG: RpiB/LacA/LacB family sugar-phosphate isomerase, partial [Flavobacteriaceae bacterium]|nr:RpiB/LacA/LacB family sugar-phosphate isomerase [Flavobacteriaceae bacterium]
MKIAIGNDHAGTEYKHAINTHLKEQGHEVTNFGTDTEDSVDYPDFVHPVAELVSKGTVDFGVLICGSGNGVSMTANKHQKVRAALC